MSILNHRMRPGAQVVGVLGIGILVGTMLTTPPHAQTEGGDAAALAAQVAELASRVAALESRKTDEAEFTAPFVVKDDSGQPVFRLDSSGGETTLILGGSGSTATLSAGKEVELNLAQGSGAVVLTSSGEGSGLAVKGSGSQIFIEQKGGAPMMRINQGGEDAFKVGADSGGMSLQLKKGGQLATLQAMPDRTGLVVTSGDHDYQAGDFKSVRGFVASAGGKPLAGLGSLGSDKFRVAIFDGGQPVFTGGFDSTSEKLGVFLADASGSDVAKIEPGSAGGKLTLMGPGGKDLATLGASEDGVHGELKLLGAGGSIAELGAVGDTGTLALLDGGAQSITLGPTKERPNNAIRVYSHGNIVFGAGAAAGGIGAAVVYSGQAVGAGMEASGSGNGSVYVFSAGKEVASINSTDKQGEGAVIVRNPAGIAVAKLGYGSAGGGNVQTTDPSGFGVFSAGYASDGAGEACVNRKTQAGTDRPACIGLGLPSAGMGK